MLLNAFGSESLKKSDNDDEDDKLSLAFVRLKEICCCCCNFKKTPRTSSVGPDELDEEKQIGMTDLENGNMSDLENGNMSDLESSNLSSKLIRIS